MSRRRLTTALVAITALSITFAAVAVAASLSRSQELRQAIDTGKARNVILLIGDGMGTSEITSARNYAVGAAG